MLTYILDIIFAPPNINEDIYNRGKWNIIGNTIGFDSLSNFFVSFYLNHVLDQVFIKGGSLITFERKLERKIKFNKLAKTDITLVSEPEPLRARSGQGTKNLGPLPLPLRRP